MTIRLRLTLAFVAMFALLTGLRAVVSIGGFRQAVDTEARHEIGGRLTAVSDYLHFLEAERRATRPPHQLTFDDPDILPRAFYDDGMFIQITSLTDQVLVKSPNLTTTRLPFAPPGLQRVEVIRASEAEPVPAMVGTRKLDLASQPPVLIQVGFPVARLDNAVASHQAVEGLVGALSLLFALVAGYAMAGRALAPAAELNEEMERLTATDLHKRLPAPEHPRDEMERLAFTFNSLLDRIEGAFEAQKRFVADASHELKSPLTAIQGYLQLLTKRGTTHPELAREWVGILTQETSRLSRLVDELLLLAKADAGVVAGQSQLAVMRLDEVATSVVGSLAGLHPRVHLESVEPVRVKGHPDHLTRLLINLVDNALRATQTGGEVYVSLRAAPEGALVIVRDTGTGIPKDALPHLFDRFYRADPARDRTHGGAGLGLAICQAIVEAHKGTIQVESQPGEGTIFTVCLPSTSERDVPELAPPPAPRTP